MGADLEQEVVEAAVDVGEGIANTAASGGKVHILGRHGVELVTDPLDGLPRHRDDRCPPQRPSSRRSPDSIQRLQLDRAVTGDRGRVDRHGRAL